LDIVFGGRDKDVEPGRFHQQVELGRLEWNVRFGRPADVFWHDEPPDAAA
jgi:hypothetical protein